jgi:hypothetical protein
MTYKELMAYLERLDCCNNRNQEEIPAEIIDSPCLASWYWVLHEVKDTRRFYAMREWAEDHGIEPWDRDREPVWAERDKWVIDSEIWPDMDEPEYESLVPGLYKHLGRFYGNLNPDQHIGNYYEAFAFSREHDWIVWCLSH